MWTNGREQHSFGCSVHNRVSQIVTICTTNYHIFLHVKHSSFSLDQTGNMRFSYCPSWRQLHVQQGLQMDVKCSTGEIVWIESSLPSIQPLSRSTQLILLSFERKEKKTYPKWVLLTKTIERSFRNEFETGSTMKMKK
jgi:hypothetical protein